MRLRSCWNESELRRSIREGGLWLWNLLFVSAGCLGEEGATSSLWQRLSDAPGVLSEWDLRQRWEDHGFRWNLFHLTYLGEKIDGGNSGMAGRLSSSVDLILRVDGEVLVGWPGVDFLAHLKSTQGANINPLVGARSQAIDDADFTEWFWIDQLWMRQYFQGRKWAVQLGYLDQQTVLDRNAFANSEDRQFMAQYLDNNNAIIPLKVGLGANIRWYPNSRWDFSLGFADADNRILHVGLETFFDGAGSWVTFSQAGRKHRLGELAGNVRLGGYFDARTAPQVGAPGFKVGHAGLFLSADQVVYREESTVEQGLGVFARYGYHDARVNRFAEFWSLGLQYDGLLPGRDRDRFGGAFYQVRPSAGERRNRGGRAGAETGIENYYLYRITPWATLTPSVQYFLNPGGDRDAQAVVTANLRLRITF